MNEFFAALGRRWTEAAHDRGAEIDPPELDSAIAFELLELARVTAQTSERRFAPLSCYLAGVAVERLRGGGGESGDAAAAAYINEVRKSLEGPVTPE
jgi:hypothetical protein